MTDTRMQTATMQPAPEVLRMMARKLCTALALYQSGVAMTRARLRREDPAASEAQIGARLAAWLRARPGEALGDAGDVARASVDSL